MTVTLLEHFKALRKADLDHLRDLRKADKRISDQKDAADQRAVELLAAANAANSSKNLYLFISIVSMLIAVGALITHR